MDSQTPPQPSAFRVQRECAHCYSSKPAIVYFGLLFDELDNPNHVSPDYRPHEPRWFCTDCVPYMCCECHRCGLNTGENEDYNFIPLNNDQKHPGSLLCRDCARFCDYCGLLLREGDQDQQRHYSCEPNPTPNPSPEEWMQVVKKVAARKQNKN